MLRTRIWRVIGLSFWVAFLWLCLSEASRIKAPPPAVVTNHLEWADFFVQGIFPTLPIAEELDPPLRPPDAVGVYITLPFLDQDHLGEDWVVAKGDGSLNEPVYALGEGWVSSAQDFQNAWGKCVFIVYRMPEERWPPFLEVLCAQLNTLEVKTGDFVHRGQKIGTIGNVNHLYKAHLHWEVRQTVGLGLGPGFSTRRDGWLEPSDILAAHRGDRAKMPLKMQVIATKDREGWGSE